MASIVDSRKSSVARFDKAVPRGATYEAYQTLHAAFVAAPVLAELDKFSHFLVDWDKYLAPQVASLLGEHAHQFMLLVGVIEIVAGLGVAAKPRYFAWVIALWLAGIIFNLLLCGTYFDIALRDFGLLLGAVALGRLATLFDSPLALDRRAA